MEWDGKGEGMAKAVGGYGHAYKRGPIVASNQRSCSQ
jgi:hypothetical protein